MKPKVSTAGLAILLLSVAVLPEIFFSTQIGTERNIVHVSSGPHTAALPSTRSFDYILIILMENKNFNQINGSSSAPYLNQLARNYSLATQYTACDHPSLPNYMCLTGANNYFSGLDCFPTGSCTTSNSSLVDEVENAGLTWRAYLEDMPSSCYKSSTGNYTYVTNPFIYYTNIGSNSTRCAAHIVPANSGGRGLPDDNLVNALGSTSTASNYMWLTPNMCDNMHNCSTSRGDYYLSKLVPLILNSYIFRTQRAVLVITFDEGLGLYPADYVYAVWAGPAVKTHYQSSIQYSHYALPSTIEVAWGLRSLTSKDRGSPSLTEFFNPPPTPMPLSAGFTFSPPNPDKDSVINFTGSATGGAQPYNYTWSFGDGNLGRGENVEYTYLSAGNYTASLNVIDASGQTAAMSRRISIDADPSLSGTCRGCTKTSFPKTLGLMISFAIGVALPLAASIIMSRRHRRSRGSPEEQASHFDAQRSISLETARPS